MFTLDAPLLDLPLAGGAGGFPPVKDPRPYARPNGHNQPKPAAAKDNRAPVISARPAFPKPAAWVEKRVLLCVRHHARFKAMRAGFAAKLEAWKRAQPGYCEIAAAVEAHESKIRQAYRARNGRAA